MTVHNLLLFSFHWRLRFLRVKIRLNVIKTDGNKGNNAVEKEEIGKKDPV